MTRSNGDPEKAFRLLPSIDEVMRDPRAVALADRLSRDDVLGFAAKAIDAWRGELRSGRLDAAELEARLASGALFADLETGRPNGPPFFASATA